MLQLKILLYLLLPYQLSTAQIVDSSQNADDFSHQLSSNQKQNISSSSVQNLQNVDEDYILDNDPESDLIFLQQDNSSWTVSGYNTSLQVTAVNETEHQGFLHGFVESLSVILVSEIGDKTFFIAAIIAMQNNKLIVFLSAISALAVMTVLSALLGFVVTQFIPRVYTYYACTGIMFLFGLKMLYEAWKMSDNEVEETQREVEEEIARRGSISSGSSRLGTTQEKSEGIDEDPEANVPMQCLQDKNEVEVETLENTAANRRTKLFTFPSTIRENSWFGKKCWKIFKLFTNTFGMTFLAEWGDRSQLATIVLAGINDVTGVCVGGVLGHFICTGLAVLCGALIAKKISVRKVTLLGALVFIGFAIASLFIDPYEENHQVPDVEGDDHSAPVYQANDISFVESTTSVSVLSSSLAQ